MTCLLEVGPERIQELSIIVNLTVNSQIAF